MEQNVTKGGKVESDRAWDLEQRLALASPDKTTRGMFLKGVLQVLKNHGDEAAVIRCMEAGGQSRITDFFSYPIAAQIRMSYTAAESLAPRVGGFEEALRLLGRQATADFLASMAGKTMLALTGRDPVKMVNSLPTAYRASVNYGQHSVEWTGPRSGRFILRGDLMPVLANCGILEAVLHSAASVRSVKVVGVQTSVNESECVFSWE